AGSAVSYVAEAGGAGEAVTALRLEGPGPSVSFRCEALRRELQSFGAHEELHGLNSALLWQEIRDVKPFVGDRALAVWRLSVPPQAGPEVVARAAGGAAYFYDWGGGLIWLSPAPEADPGGGAIRSAVAERGGHATLVRAPAEVRASVAVFQPVDQAKARIVERVKDSFDPRRVLNPGRMYAGL
ncbi:MAG: 2-hydroxy-acid oxidase, partial [Kiloniellales bacterium]|nr:2-hydroxy-acid oxidase [Kiloniellales bacterium]